MGASGRVALVTGASSGFGLLASVELARRGFRVFGSMRDVARADALKAAAAEAKVEVETVSLDVTQRASIEAAMRDISSRAGGVDVLVNNAGVGIGGAFEDTSDDELRWVMETNFFGAATLTRLCVPWMRSRGWGRVINVSSLSGRVGAPGFSAYSSSKFALEGMTEAIRNELLPFGIHVVLIEPGSFRTEIFGRNKHLASGAKNPSSPYVEMSRRMEEMVDSYVGRFAGDANVVAKRIVHAATARNPSLRYLIGPDARAAVLSKNWVPDAILEWVYGRTLRLNAKRLPAEASAARGGKHDD